MGDRPLRRQAGEAIEEATEEPAPVQLSRPRQHSDWVESARLPGIGTSPFAPAFAPASRPLIGAAPLLAPDAAAPDLPGASPAGVAGAAPDIPGAPLARVGGAAPPALARGPAVQRGIGPAAVGVAQPSRSDAGAPTVQLMRSLPTETYRPPAIPAGAPPHGAHRGPAVLPPVQRSALAKIADPGAAAIGAGVASRDADGSVVFRSYLDDATSSVQDAASPAASSAISDARSSATDATSAALSSASETAHGAVSQVSSSATSAAGLPAAGGAAATGDLDDLARKLYDRLRFRLSTELRLDRERSGCVTDLPH